MLQEIGGGRYFHHNTCNDCDIEPQISVPRSIIYKIEKLLADAMHPKVTFHNNLNKMEAEANNIRVKTIGMIDEILEPYYQEK